MPDQVLSGPISKTAANLAASEKACEDAQTSKDRAEAEAKSLADRNRSLVQQVSETRQQLAELQKQVAANQAEKNDRIKRVDAVGRWEQLGFSTSSSPDCRIELREDGTGTISGGGGREYGEVKHQKADSLRGIYERTWRETEAIDYRITYEPTNEPGVFAVYGAWRETKTPVSGVFRVKPDGTATLEGMSAIIRPITLSRESKVPVGR